MFMSVLKFVSCAVVLTTLIASCISSQCEATSAFVPGRLPKQSLGVVNDCSRRITAASSPATFAARKTVTSLSADVGGSGPAVIDRPQTVQKKDVKKEDELKDEQKHGSEGWEVRLYNDPMNKREFVARCLTEICGMSDGESYQVMMQAHQNGLAVVGRYMFERAEMYHDALRDNGLFVDMIQVDDD